jgi:hypothetical protein
MCREAVRPAYLGSRADLERVTEARVGTGLLLLFLGGRAIHLVQALIDVSIGYAAYTRGAVAVTWAVCCALESTILGAIALRRGRLTRAPLLGDAVFGLCGLVCLSYATVGTAGRTGSINWMLPYCVATAAGLGLLAGERRRVDWSSAVTVLVLAATNAASMGLLRSSGGDPLGRILLDSANFPLFYLGAVGLARRLRRRLDVIAAGNEHAKTQAAQIAAQAHWRAVSVDVFGPVLDLLDRATVMGDEVPPALRAEARRLIGLIEATNPRAGVGW